MTRYRFRLETVLRVRRAEESEGRAALVHAQAQVRQAIASRDESQQRYREVVTAASAPITAEELRRQACVAAVVADVAASAQRNAVRVAGEAALAQVRWAQAARRVAALERLEARRRAEHAEDERRAEVALVDALVTARYGRGSSVAEPDAQSEAVR